MILCDTEILAALRHGQLVLDPEPPRENFTTSAVDLTLGKEFKRWNPPQGAGVHATVDPAHSEFSYPQLARRLHQHAA